MNRRGTKSQNSGVLLILNEQLPPRESSSKAQNSVLCIERADFLAPPTGGGEYKPCACTSIIIVPKLLK